MERPQAATRPGRKQRPKMRQIIGPGIQITNTNKQRDSDYTSWILFVATPRTGRSSSMAGLETWNSLFTK